MTKRVILLPRKSTPFFNFFNPFFYIEQIVKLKFIGT